MEHSENIEITEEMIEAGATAIRRWDERFSDEEALAEEVFRVMVRHLDGREAIFRA